MSAATLAPVEAAVRARRQATAVAAVGAVVPTILAAQGMTSLAVDVLGFPLLAAVALASFLELALVASALLARAAALAGRPGGADALAVWVVSGTSGLLAGVHELMTVTPEGTTWSADPGTALAAAVRVLAPLVAAWLWERVLRAARAEQAERTLAEIRRDRRLLAVARAALAMRRMEEAGRASGPRARRAARRLDRTHVAALRVAPPAPTLVDVLAAVGQVDHLPAATLVAPLGRRPIEGAPATLARAADEDVTGHVADQVAETVAAPLLAARAHEDVTGHVAGPFPGARVAVDFMEDAPEADRAPDVAPRAVFAAALPRPSSVTAQVADDQAPFVDVPLFDVVNPEPEPESGAAAVVDPVADERAAKWALAVELMRSDPELTGARLAVELTQRGHRTAARSGVRWRARALAALAEPVAEPVTVS